MSLIRFLGANVYHFFALVTVKVRFFHKMLFCFCKIKCPYYYFVFDITANEIVAGVVVVSLCIRMQEDTTKRLLWSAIYS